MIIQDIERPTRGEPLLPPAQQRVRRRLGNFVIASGLIERPPQDLDALVATGFVPILEAGLGLAATSCQWPLALDGCASLAQAFGVDALVMRYDALSGVSFDVLLREDREWQSPFAAWRRPGMDIWLIPMSGSGPYIHVDKKGLHPQDAAPFCNDQDRALGIIRAVAHPSFKGER